MDTFYTVSSPEVTELGYQLGSMNLIPEDFPTHTLPLSNLVKEFPGGSCANTLRALAWVLGTFKQKGLIQFIGTVGEDQTGYRYESALREAGVIPLLLKSPNHPTGTSRILVDERGERTMFTCLGASQASTPMDYNSLTWSKPQILYSTGYMFDTANQRDFILSVYKKERGRGTFTVFDLADPWAVKRHKEFWKTWIPGAVDLVFANEQELLEFTGKKELAEALKAAKNLAAYLVVKRGAKGSVFLFEGKLFKTPGVPVNALDTTGAGDAFAGGFLAGVLMGLPWELTCRLANAMGAGIVTQEGCDFRALRPSLVWDALGKKNRVT